MRIIRKYFYLAGVLIRFLSSFLSGLLALKAILLFFYVIGDMNNFTDTSVELILRCNIIVDSLIFLSSLFTVIRIFRLTHRLPVKIIKMSFIFLSVLLSPIFIFVENILLVFLSN